MRKAIAKTVREALADYRARCLEVCMTVERQLFIPEGNPWRASAEGCAKAISNLDEEVGL